MGKRPNARKPLTDVDRNMIFSLKKRAGLKPATIAIRFGIGEETVKEIVNEMQLKRNLEANRTRQLKEGFHKNFKEQRPIQTPQAYNRFGITTCSHCGQITSADNRFCKCGEPIKINIAA